MLGPGSRVQAAQARAKAPPVPPPAMPPRPPMVQPLAYLPPQSINPAEAASTCERYRSSRHMRRPNIPSVSPPVYPIGLPLNAAVPAPQWIPTPASFVQSTMAGGTKHPLIMPHAFESYSLLNMHASSSATSAAGAPAPLGSAPHLATSVQPPTMHHDVPVEHLSHLEPHTTHSLVSDPAATATATSSSSSSSTTAMATPSLHTPRTPLSHHHHRSSRSRHRYESDMFSEDSERMRRLHRGDVSSSSAGTTINFPAPLPVPQSLQPIAFMPHQPHKPYQPPPSSLVLPPAPQHLVVHHSQHHHHQQPQQPQQQSHHSHHHLHHLHHHHHLMAASQLDAQAAQQALHQGAIEQPTPTLALLQ